MPVSLYVHFVTWLAHGGSEFIARDEPWMAFQTLEYSIFRLKQVKAWIFACSGSQRIAWNLSLTTLLAVPNFARIKKSTSVAVLDKGVARKTSVRKSVIIASNPLDLIIAANAWLILVDFLEQVVVKPAASRPGDIASKSVWTLHTFRPAWKYLFHHVLKLILSQFFIVSIHRACWFCPFFIQDSWYKQTDKDDKKQRYQEAQLLLPCQLSQIELYVLVEVLVLRVLSDPLDHLGETPLSVFGQWQLVQLINVSLYSI